MSFYAFLKKILPGSNSDNFYNWYNSWFWYRFLFFLGCAILIIGGLGSFSFSARASNEKIGNVKYGCIEGNLSMKFICKVSFSGATRISVAFNQDNLMDYCGGAPRDVRDADLWWIWWDDEFECVEAEERTLTLDYCVHHFDLECASTDCWETWNCETVDENDYIAFVMWMGTFYWDFGRYYFLGDLESGIEITYPEEDATITTDILEAIIDYINFDNFYWLEWEIQKWENATFTFWEEGFKETEEGKITDTINFYPIYEDSYYRFKVALRDGDIADIWTGWRYFITSETFEYYPPGEPEAWLPIDKEAFYIKHRGEATPTIAWTGITNIVDVVLNPVGNWTYFFAGFFSITGLHETTANINTKINLIRGYFNYFDNFFGGFPIALIFGIFIIVLIGKTIISMVFKVINLIKP